MKIELWLTGKTTFDFIGEGMSLYQNRIIHYTSFTMEILPEAKHRQTPEAHKQMEAETILKKIKHGDIVILLDEKGKNMDSVSFATFLEQQMVQSSKKIIFIIGGAYGFAEKIYERSNYLLSLSKMTFSHQIVRLLFMEQLYRAFTIIKGEQYHNN